MEAMIEKIENNVCSVCFEKGEQEKISGDQGHTLIKCTRCYLKVHLRCYGEKNPLTKRSTAKNSEEGLFECEKCLNKETSCVCVVCNVKDGYMLRLDQKKYVHVICAMFTDYFEIIDFLKMKIEPKIPIEEIEKICTIVNNKDRCDICMSSQGVLLECECKVIEQNSQCGRKVHFYCATRERYAKLSSDAEATDYWQIDWKFNYKGSFDEDINDVYNTMILSKRNELNTLVKCDGKINTNISDVRLEEPNDTATVYDSTKKNSKAVSKPKKPSKAKAGKKSNLAEDPFGTVSTAVANEILMKSLHTKFIKTNEKNWPLKNRGGEIKILCKDHRENITYCICRKSSGSEFMICCDNCEVWFHGRCLGFSNKEINSLKKWYCSFCTEWINNRNNFLLKEANEELNEDLIDQAKSKSWKLPVIHNHLHYKVIDLLFISILYWRKAEVLLKYPCTSEILSKHIRLCYEIPFNLSRPILNLKTKWGKYSKLNNEIENHFLDKFKNISFYDFHLVNIIEMNNLNVDNNDVRMIQGDENIFNNLLDVSKVADNSDLQIRLNTENYNRIVAYHDDLEKLFTKTHDSVEGIINENFEFLEKTLKQLKWAKRVFEVIAQSAPQSSLQDVKSVYLSYSDLFSLPLSSTSSNALNPSASAKNNEHDYTSTNTAHFYREYMLVTKYMTDYGNWQKSTKEMLSSHMKQKGEAEKIIQDLESKIQKEEVNLSNLEAKENYGNYLTYKLALIEKYKDKMKINLSTKIPLEKIKEIISIGRNLKINASKEIESIDSCLGEALEWDSAFENLKQQTSLKFEEIQKLILNSTNILVCTPLMYQAVELFSEFEIFSANVQNFLYNEKNFQANNFYELTKDYETKFHVFKDEVFLRKIDSLFKIHEKIIKIKNHVKDNLINNNEIKILKQLKEGIEKEHKYILKEEIEKLDQKIFYLNNIENLLNQKNDMKSLELIERLINEYNINSAKDCNIKEKINLKKGKISEIKSKIFQILCNTGKTNTEEIEIKYTKLITIKEEILHNNIQLEEEINVEDSIKIIEWYKRTSLKFKDLLELQEDINNLNNSENILSDLIESLNLLQEFEKNSQIIHTIPEIKTLFEKLQFFVWIIKVDRILKILNEENSSEENKIEISELNSLIYTKFLSDPSVVSLPTSYIEGYNSRYLLIENIISKINLWQENYKSLEISIYTEGVKNFELCSMLLSNLQNDTIISEKINLSSYQSTLTDIKTILKISEKLITILESKNLPIENRPDREQVLHTIKECETKLSEQKIKFTLRQFFHWGEISKELEKFESWIENYSQYVNHKRNNQADKIDFSLLEVLQEESKRIIVNLSSEVALLRRDLDLNRNWIFSAKMLIEQSENLNNIDFILENKESEENLEKIYSQLINNQVSIQDKNLADLIKSLQWATRARSLLKSVENNPLSKLNYRIAFRTSQEANSLKHFFEIKKKDYYTNLLSQVTLAKNIRDISEILKNSSNVIVSHMQNLSGSSLHQFNLKQVSEEQFEKIVKDFLNKCHVDLPEEREIVESFVKTKSQFEKKFENFVTNKINLTEYEKLLAELKKFPIHLEKLIREIESIIHESKIYLRDIRKILEQFNTAKNVAGAHSGLLTKEKTHFIYERYKNSKASFQEGDQLMKMYDTSEEKLKKLKSALASPSNSENSDTFDIYDLINLIDSIEVHNFTEEKILRKKLWKRKFDFFVNNSSESPSFSQIRNLVIEANELNMLTHSEDNCQEEYTKLLDICEKSHEILREIFSTITIEEFSNVKNTIFSENSGLKIDFGDYLIEQETRLGLNKILPQAQVNRNIENLFLGIKRKNEENFRTIENSRNKKFQPPSVNVKESVGIRKSVIEEENYEKETEKDKDNLNILPSDSHSEKNFLTNSNVQPLQTGIGNTRSKRKVNLKLDKDYLYDKEFIDNFENKIAKRLKKSSSQNDLEIEKQDQTMEVFDSLYKKEEKIFDDENNDQDFIDQEKNPKQSKDKNQNLSLSKSTSEQIEIPTETNSSKTSLIKNLIKKNPTNEVIIPSINQIDRNKFTTDSKKLSNQNPISLRQISVESLKKILYENPTFSKEGEEYIAKLTHELEEELFKSYNKLDQSYTKGFENMCKTVKELEKYKRVSILVTKGKLSLPKVAKFPYGEKYFDKLRKIDESVQTQISRQKKINENEIEKKTSIQDLPNVEAKQGTNLISMISDIDKLYSSLNKSSKIQSECKVYNKSTSVTELGTENDDENNQNYMNDDNNSLKSLSDKEDVRFSPDGRHFIKSGSNLITTANTKSSNLQSPSSPVLFKKEISTISTFENIYNPFEIEDDEKDKETSFDFEYDMKMINVSSVKSKSLQKKNLVHPIFYDPFKNSDNRNISADINSPDLLIKKKSTNNFDSIFQIWKGDVTINKLNLNNVVMLSTNTPENFTSIQNLPEEINISSKAKTKEVIPYIERYLSNKSDKISYGWFEIENEDEVESYQAIANDYDKNDRSGFHSFNDIKYYIFTLSKRYAKFYKKMKNEFRIFNKSLMNHIDKLIVFVMIRKNDSKENLNECDNIFRQNCIKPIVLLTLSNEKSPLQISVKQKEKNSNSTTNIVEYNNMSPITSDEEDNRPDEEESLKNQEEKSNQKITQYTQVVQQIESSNDYLAELLSGDDLEKLEEYVNSQFANLSQEEIIQKLISLDENSRAKLLNLIMEYQQRVSAGIASGNQEQNDNDEVDEEQSNPEEGNDNKDLMDVDETYDKYQEVPESKANTRKNDHLSYLGFSNSNASADLLKKEILKNQGQNNRHAEGIINEDNLMKNMNFNFDNQANRTGVPNTAAMSHQMQYMNMNYPMMNMNQAYMMNPGYTQNINYHQMNAARPNMQMMMQRGQTNYNGMIQQNLGNLPPQAQVAYNTNLYNQRMMNSQSSINILNNKRDN